jgi:rhamnosyltransferase
MATFDPRGTLGPHVRRQVDALAGSVDDVVVVSTSTLDDEARRFLAARVRLVERANTGYDFLSYRAGLEAVGDLTAYDEVTVCNDSCVGPLVPYAEVFATMAGRPADFWGLTETDRVRHHVQSFFVTFRPAVLASPAFASFWDGVEVLPDRSQVIRRYEVGLSRHLYRAGFASAPYVEEGDAERRLARRRVAWWALGRTGVPRGRADVALLRKRARVPWNPSIALADRPAMPYVKIDTLRYDPYGLGADRLLARGEREHPAAFEGVRGYLADTAAAYPPRAAETLRRLPAPVRAARRVVEYDRG